VGCVVNREQTFVTLKRKPRWWNGAPGLEFCTDLARQRDLNSNVANTYWERRWCDDYVCGRDDISSTPHASVVIDIGMHDGGDTIYWLSRGFRVIAVDANMDLRVLGRPVIASAAQTGQLVFVHAAVAPTNSSASVTFYRHKTASQLSTMYAPPSKRHLFDAVVLNTTTCAKILHRYGAPLYIKIDIEGADAACVKSLSQSKARPSYISTEDPTLLATLKRLGYRRFKLIPQHTHRTNGQFSGGWPEALPEPWVRVNEIRRHRFFNMNHMHEAVTSDGRRIRMEHDLHARMW
jgi:FkbM family methyltransferase